MNTLARRQILIIGGLIVGILILAVLFIVSRSSNQPIPTQSITPPATVSTASSSINGTENLARTGLSDRQATQIKSSLEAFLATRPDISTLTVNVSDATNVFDKVNNYYVYTFALTTDKGILYTAKVKYVATTDSLTSVYNASGVLVYTPASD